MRNEAMRWLCVALCVACSGDDDSTGPDGTTPDTDTQTESDTGTPVECPTPSVTLGTGLFGFEAIGEGEPLEMVYGDQGGWHFDTAAEVVGFGPDVLFVGSATVVRNGEVIAGNGSPPVAVDMSRVGLGTWDPSTCSGSFYGQLTFLDDVEVGSGVTLIQRMCALDGEDVTFTVEVTNPATDEVFSSSVTVLARLDPTTPCP